MSVTSVCAYGSVTMYEMSWIGEPKVRTENEQNFKTADIHIHTLTLHLSENSVFEDTHKKMGHRF